MRPEALAEKFHAKPALLPSLNLRVTWALRISTVQQSHLAEARSCASELE
jgi:hypothetical protein